METRLQELKKRLLEVNDLASAARLLFWDQSTYMPSGGTSARARQLGTLQRLAHEKFTDPFVGKLLEDLRPYEESLPYDSDEAGLIRITRRKYERSVKIPAAFKAELAGHASESYQAWARARPVNNFAAVQTCLEKTLDLSRRLADFFPGYEHIADPLINFSDYGVKVSEIRPLFTGLKKKLIPLVRAVSGQSAPDDSCLRKNFPEEKQISFAGKVVTRLGYDFARGRHDQTLHPFMTAFSLGDVRITFRSKPDDLREGLFSMLHEAGHALYEQGISREFEGTPLADGTSAGVHESQSRLWENLVGRSREFWRFFYPGLRQTFPDQLNPVPLDVFYRAINKVEPSLIRTDADEVTYNLHVMLRFELELELLEGRLAVRDLPEAWRQRYQNDLGIVPPDDRDGVLQDVHWYAGTIGGSFQGYTLGNIMSAQFFRAALHAHPEILDEIEKGEFTTVHEWLKENIYQHGSKYTTSELLARITGGSFNIEPYVRYLRKKYGELYKL